MRDVRWGRLAVVMLAFLIGAGLFVWSDHLAMRVIAITLPIIAMRLALGGRSEGPDPT